MLITGHVPDIKYPIWISRGFSGKIFNYIPEVLQCGRVAVVTDREEQALHMDRFKQQFEEKNIELKIITIDGTEAGKNLDTAKLVYDHLNDLALTTEDVLIAFGGGSILDITAFVASTYLGGISFWQIPTTLLSMIDSSISTVCHLNFRSSKDMISTNSAPQGVIIDPDLLDTLAPKQKANGYVRMIQYGYLQNPKLIDMLEADDCEISKLIALSIHSKLELINKDPFFLSFGQPVSDAIQGHFRFLKYLHGEAVALGMLASSPTDRLCNLLKKYDLPVFIEGVNQDTLVKKAARICCLQGQRYKFVKVMSPGQIEIESIEAENYESVLNQMISVLHNS